VTGLCADHLRPGVLRLRLDRPARRNALDRPLVEALLGAFDAPDEPVVVLGSTSRTAFCAGADLTLEDAERAVVSDLLYALYGRMAACEAIVVAALDGPAVGGGAQLAIAADLRVAAPQARLQIAGPGHGLSVAAWSLPSLVGRGRALDLCLTMRPVDAEEALAIGLVDRVVPDAGAGALELAEGLAALEPAAAARVKRVAWAASGALGELGAERSANREAWTGSMTRDGAAHG
jgi:enoyl-CoA hydratase/carnithine racemase